MHAGPWCPVVQPGPCPAGPAQAALCLAGRLLCLSVWTMGRSLRRALGQRGPELGTGQVSVLWERPSWGNGGGTAGVQGAELGRGWAGWSVARGPMAVARGGKWVGVVWGSLARLLLEGQWLHGPGKGCLAGCAGEGRWQSSHMGWKSQLSWQESSGCWGPGQ